MAVASPAKLTVALGAALQLGAVVAVLLLRAAADGPVGDPDGGPSPLR